MFTSSYASSKLSSEVYLCLSLKCEAHNHTGAVGTSRALVWGYGYMYVCMSVRNRFTIEMYGFVHNLRTFLAHAAIAMEVEDWEDRRRQQVREWLQRYRGWLNAQQIDERRQDNGDLHIRIWTIYFSCWSVNKMSGRQHDVVSTILCHFSQSNFPCAWCEAHDVHSLIPRPLPDFFSQPWRKIRRKPGIKTTSRTGNGGLGCRCKIKSGSGLGMRLWCTCIYLVLII